MRKMLKSKKGFSLVELMIVVVIMGILIAVAVPLYGAVTKSSKNKSCEQNATSLRESCRNYYIAYNDNIPADELAKSLESEKLPTCPWHEGAEVPGGSYTVTAVKGGEGRVFVECVEATGEFKDDHVALDNGSVKSATEAGGATIVKAGGTTTE